MILRILGEGQFEVGDDLVAELNTLDEAILSAIEAQDEDAFRAALVALRDKAISGGTPVADDYLGESDLILPSPDSSIAEVESMLTEEGFIPD